MLGYASRQYCSKFTAYRVFVMSVSQLYLMCLTQLPGHSFKNTWLQS